MKLSHLTPNTNRRRAAWRLVGLALSLADDDFASTFRHALNLGTQRMAAIESARVTREWFEANLTGGGTCGTPD